MIEVIRPGTKVSLPQAEIVNAVVIAAMIQTNDRVRYLCVWWSGAERKEEWVEACEVSAEVPAWVPVGFVVPKRSDQ